MLRLTVLCTYKYRDALHPFSHLTIQPQRPEAHHKLTLHHLRSRRTLPYVYSENTSSRADGLEFSYCWKYRLSESDN
jgi:hypothetical protein